MGGGSEQEDLGEASEGCDGFGQVGLEVDSVTTANDAISHAYAIKLPQTPKGLGLETWAGEQVEMERK